MFFFVSSKDGKRQSSKRLSFSSLLSNPLSVVSAGMIKSTGKSLRPVYQSYEKGNEMMRVCSCCYRNMFRISITLEIQEIRRPRVRQRNQALQKTVPEAHQLTQ